MDDLKQSLEEQAKALKEKSRSDQSGSSQSPAVGTATSVDSRDPQLPNRPVGVTILSIGIGLFSLAFFSMLMLLPILFSPTDRAEVEDPLMLVGIGVGAGVGLAFGALYIAVALGLWRLRNWARWGANVILALTLLGVPLSGASSDPLVVLTVLAACIGGLWYLNRRKVRDLFYKESKEEVNQNQPSESKRPIDNLTDSLAPGEEGPMDLHETAGVNQRQVAHTKTEVGLATLLSIFLYTVLWIVPVLAGVFLPTPISAGLILILQLVASKLNERPRFRSLAIDISIAVSVGILNKAATGMGFYSFDICFPLSVLVGGFVTGVIRRGYFVPALKKKLIKYSLLLCVILVIPVLSLFVLGTFVNRLDIPVERLYPAKIAEGWVPNDQPGIFDSRVLLNKESSALLIDVNHFDYDPPSTKEEFENFYIAPSLAGIELVSFGSDTTKRLTREETVEVNNQPLSIWQYDFGGDRQCKK